jgi:SanA protein
MLRNLRRHWLRSSIIALVALLIAILAIDQWVLRSTRQQIFSDVSTIPHRKVGLLLGTSKFGSHGRINYYYQYRIQAAVALFKAGRIDYVLVSGDNRHASYNEPETMQADLIAAGIPSERIVLDYAGFRTLDSIMRCLYVFGEDDITIISQPFHNARALFIANRKGIKAIAFNATDVSAHQGIKVKLREKGTRVKMILDLLFGKQPKFYGPPVPIG